MPSSHKCFKLLFVVAGLRAHFSDSHLALAMGRSMRACRTASAHGAGRPNVSIPTGFYNTAKDWRMRNESAILENESAPNQQP